MTTGGELLSPMTVSSKNKCIPFVHSISHHILSQRGNEFFCFLRVVPKQRVGEVIVSLRDTRTALCRSRKPSTKRLEKGQSLSFPAKMLANSINSWRDSAVP